MRRLGKKGLTKVYLLKYINISAYTKNKPLAIRFGSNGFTHYGIYQVPIVLSGNYLFA